MTKPARTETTQPGKIDYPYAARIEAATHKAMPQNKPSEAAQLGGSCISAVESIELAE